MGLNEKINICTNEMLLSALHYEAETSIYEHILRPPAQHRVNKADISNN